MAKFVTFDCALVTESLSTNITAVRFYIYIVGTFVSDEGRSTAKNLTTSATRVRIVAGVDAFFVSCEALIIIKRITTHVTCKWLHAAVDTFVSVASAKLSKHLSASVASIRHFPGVDPLVSLECT